MKAARRTILAAMAASALPFGAAGAADRTAAGVLMSDVPGIRKYQDDWGFADAVIAGDLMFLSGVIVAPREGDADLSVAYDRAYREVGKILKRAGLGWENVVDITSFHTDISGQLPSMVAVQKSYIKAPPPAWTAVQVVRLIPERGITEIKFIAHRAPREHGN
jgi:enamine deaminase RidA (YjgF/YER057c/UK114 family)